MPSASVKTDKQITPESALSDSTGTLTPLRQAITVIEHKIRNLEKRKSKLESYRELQSSGKDLNADQKTAVAKYDEVVQTLEFARDLSKQFLGIVVVTEKDAKKQARKEAAAKSQAELAKLREVLLVQDALNQMGNDAVREDFLSGTNGATSLTQTDLSALDDLYPAVTPKHEAGNPTAFTAHVQSAAEHLLAVVDGKSKEAFGTTYSQIKDVIGKVHESGYLDQALVESDEQVEEEEQVLLEQVNDQSGECHETQSLEVIQSSMDQSSMEHQSSPRDKLPSQPPPHHDSLSESVSAPPPPMSHHSHPQPPQHHPHPAQQQQQHVQPQPVLQQQQQPQPTHVMQPTVLEQQQPPQQMMMDGGGLQQVGVVEQPPQQLYYQQPPQPRPIADVLGPGSFFFLQDSEIDNPALVGGGDQPPSINSQTFTNQTYVGGGGGGGNIAPAPNMQTIYTQQAPVVPQQVLATHHIPQQQPQHHSHHHHQQQQSQQISSSPQQQQQQQSVNVSPVRKSYANNNGNNGQVNNGVDNGEGGGEKYQRGSGQRSHPRNSNYQPFYANNNGYGNRNNRSGPPRARQTNNQ